MIAFTEADGGAWTVLEGAVGLGLLLSLPRGSSARLKGRRVPSAPGVTSAGVSASVAEQRTHGAVNPAPFGASQVQVLPDAPHSDHGAAEREGRARSETAGPWSFSHTRGRLSPRSPSSSPGLHPGAKGERPRSILLAVGARG